MKTATYRNLSCGVLLTILVVIPWDLMGKAPNILLAISDDQSWTTTSITGNEMVHTPAFDGVAREGVLFTQAICGSPGCSPSRASLLTGRHTWMIQGAGTHASDFPSRYTTFPDLLEASGYHVGFTGKGWGPGNWRISGRTRNPAGPAFSEKASPESGQSDYVSSFSAFLDSSGTSDDRPFFFWFGSHDPHRGFEKGSGLKAGKSLNAAKVPAFLPDTPEVRSDLLDYAWEVERFDRDLSAMLEILKNRGELSDTLVIVTSDNGMAFPRAKANCYEYGIHVPLAISWPGTIPGGRQIDDPVGFVDLTATILDAAGFPIPAASGMTGNSLMPMLRSAAQGIVESGRRSVYSARERHSSSRFNSLGYPQRCIRTGQFLYIINFKPERWPAGPSSKLRSPVFDDSGRLVEGGAGPDHDAYHDIDACPTLDFMIANRHISEIGELLQLSVGLRPGDELFDIKKDPACLHNLAEDPGWQTTRSHLRMRLWNYLQETGDPRVTGNGDIWESYPRYSPLRWFEPPTWATDSPELIPEMPWLEERKPRRNQNQ